MSVIESVLMPRPFIQHLRNKMDGTLCEPQTWMFARMRGALGIDKSVDILEHIESLPLDQQPVAEEAIRAVEREAMVRFMFVALPPDVSEYWKLGMIAQPGLRPLMEYLASRGIPKSSELTLSPCLRFMADS